MSILSIQTTAPTGLASVNPEVIYILTSDTFATVTTTGYLTQQAAQGFTFNNYQMALVYTTDSGPIWLRVVITYSGATVLNTVVSLVDVSNAGDVVLPTIANHIATYTNTTGTLSEDAATAINGGNIQAGLSGTAGYLASFPTTLAKGSLRLTAIANTNDTLVTISNALHGQASVYSIPDSGNAVGRFLVGATATPFVSGNFPVASGTAGLMVDSGKSAANLPTFTSPTIANHIAVFTNTAGNLGEDVSTAINGGSIQAGLAGTAGTVISFPATTANGSLILAAVNAGGAFNTTISNGTMAQSSVYTIPDVTASTGQFVVKTAAFVSGNLIQASGTAGVTVDSGVTTTNVQLKTQVKAVLTGNIGGAGAGPLAVTVAGMTAASVVVATVASSSNPCYVLTALPGSGSFALTVSADPGASLIVNYIAYIAAQ